MLLGNTPYQYNILVKIILKTMELATVSVRMFSLAIFKCNQDVSCIQTKMTRRIVETGYVRPPDKLLICQDLHCSIYWYLSDLMILLYFGGPILYKTKKNNISTKCKKM